MTLRFTPETSIAFIDDQPLILSQSQRALYEVNQIGGYIACRLEDGVSLRQLTREVEDRGFDEASTVLADVLAHWSHSGLVCAMEIPPVGPVAMTQAIALGGRGLALRYHDQALADHIAPVFAHLEGQPAAIERRYDIWSLHGLALFSRDGGQATILQPAQAATIVKARLMQDIINDPCWSLALHAACLHRNGRALLLTGRPGAGKTTLTSWLLANGFAYQGDDITMFNADGQVQGLPFLPTVKSGAWPLMSARYADRLQSATHWRPDGKRVRYLVPPGPIEQASLSVGWIVMLRRSKGGAARLEPLQPARVIRQLLSEAASANGEVDRAALDTLIRTVAAARAFELHYDDLDEAAALLDRLCADGAA
ncbi:hypothetical protein [Rhizorhapis sp. SPR117]|uniref:hypothetical protein n=1 Tax=Rhizorhapis sp. SPR117 TaxID=2912611 RepID=UPI001F47715F|nr:hypothetical protein [Rhizorhapis sp. SPR117]